VLRRLNSAEAGVMGRAIRLKFAGRELARQLARRPAHAGEEHQVNKVESAL